MKNSFQPHLLIVLSSLLLLPTKLCLAAGPDLPAPFIEPSALTRSDVATQLGWLDTPGRVTLCGGFYQDFAIPQLTLATDQTQIKAGNTLLRQLGASYLSGTVIANQLPDRQLSAEEGFIYRDKTTGEFTTMDLLGKVRLQETGQYIVGDKAHVQLQQKTGQYFNTLYRISLDPYALSPTLLQASTNPQKSLTAHGQAQKISQLAKGKLDLENATYSTCAPIAENWRLKAKKIHIDRATGRGIAHSAMITVKDIPVFYTPYFNFPIDSRRQSGFLFPTFSSSNNNGFAISIPYYWNIAPNYDWLITPTYFGKHGLQLNNVFRYLSPTSVGNIKLTVLPNDTGLASLQRTAPVTYANKPELVNQLNDLRAANTTRSFFSWQHFNRLNPHWTGDIDYSAASDDYYLQDFSNIPTLSISNQLLQQAKLNYAGDRWNFQGMLQQYQTLHPLTLAPVNNQYARLPQLLFTGGVPDTKTGLVFQFNSELVHFRRSLNPGEKVLPPAGDRIILQPGVSLPLIGAAGYITPTVQFNAAQYALANQPSNYANNMFRSVPIISLDSGLYFDRNLSFAAQDYQQTLELRLMYLYIPNKEQYQIPLFDTGLQVFNYDQIFRTNRFSGVDRIGDANQISIGLTTRFIDQETGLEKLRASIGQIYYFRDRKVMLCGIKGCADTLTAVGATSTTSLSSPIAGQINYALNQQWNASANLTWDIPTKEIQNSSFNFQYQPKANHILNLGYNFIRYGDILVPTNLRSDKNNLNQASASFALPIRQHWNTVGGLAYNVSHKHAQSFFYGAEYNTCCWAARVVLAHTFNGLSSFNTPIFTKVIYLQLLLKGMSNFGTNDPSLITNTIAGYQDNFGRNTF